MKGKGKQEWIEKGYEMLSAKGFGQVNVESIARALEKNKSSFYYYFGDWEGFEEDVLNYHLFLAKDFALKVEQCNNIVPELIDLFIEHKTDIFFHKQLRINRHNPHFQKCFQNVYALFEGAAKDKWSTFLGLNHQPHIATEFMSLLSENFLLQITEENYTQEWAISFFQDASKLMKNVGDLPKPQ